MPHQINLGQAWTTQTDPTQTDPTETNETNPNSVHFTRRFQWVAQLSSHEKLFLVFQGRDLSKIEPILLNNAALQPLTFEKQLIELELTNQVQKSNTISVSTDSAMPPWDRVFLEIRSSHK